MRQALRKLGKRPSHIVEVHQGRIGNRIDEALVIPPDDLPKIERRPLVVSVAGTENRQTIRDALTAIGFVEGRDYFCAA